MKTGHGIAASILVAMLCVTTAHAVDVRGTFALGYDAGGDDLLKVTFDDGSSSSIAAGDGFYFNGGAIASLNEEKTVDLALTVGWKIQQITASNGDAALSRFPLEGVLFFNKDNHRFGAGATYHLAIDYSAGGDLSEAGTDLESDVGFVVQYDYTPFSRTAIGVKYTELTYRATEFGDAEVNAGSWGAFMASRF